MHEVEVVTEPEALTPLWLTRALRRAGHDVSVTEVRTTPVGTGQIGASYRLDYEAIGAAYGVQTARGDEMFSVMTARSLQAMRDLSSIEAV